MGYRNYCCQCNCLAPRYSQPKAIVPFSPMPSNCCKCTSFVPRGRFPNDKVFFVCCQECVIKSPKDISRLYKVPSSSSSSTVEQGPCCCFNQCASCLMKQMVKQTLRKGKRKSRDEHEKKKHLTYDRGDSREQTSDYESTEKPQYRKSRSSSFQKSSRGKKQKEQYSRSEVEQKGSPEQSDESSWDEREEQEEDPYKTSRRRRATYDDSSFHEYQPLPKPKPVKKKEHVPKVSRRRGSVNQREDRSKDPSAKQRLSLPRPKKISFDKSRDSLTLMKTRSNYSSKTKASKKSYTRKSDSNKGRKRSEIQWDDGLYEPDPRLFGVDSYNYEPCTGNKYDRPPSKVTKREANASDWMRIRLEKLDQYRSKSDRLPNECRKTCSPCQTSPPCQPQRCQGQPCNFYQPAYQNACYPSFLCV